MAGVPCSAHGRRQVGAHVITELRAVPGAGARLVKEEAANPCLERAVHQRHVLRPRSCLAPVEHWLRASTAILVHSHRGTIDVVEQLGGILATELLVQVVPVEVHQRVQVHLRGNAGTALLQLGADPDDAPLLVRIVGADGVRGRAGFGPAWRVDDAHHLEPAELAEILLRCAAQVSDREIRNGSARRRWPGWRRRGWRRGGLHPNVPANRGGEGASISEELDGRYAAVPLWIERE